MASDVPVPETLDFTDAEIKKATKRATYAEGTHARWIVTDASRGEAKSGHLQLSFKCAALRDVDDANSKEKRLIFDKMFIPKVNPNRPGHKAPNTYGLCVRTLHAMFPEDVPLEPRRDGEGNIIFKGEIIDKGDEEAARDECKTATFDKIKEVWADPSLLVNQAFYAVVKVDGEYTNLDRHSDEPVTDKEGNVLELTAPENFYGSDDEETEEVEEKTAAKKPAAKTNGKKR